MRRIGLGLAVGYLVVNVALLVVLGAMEPARGIGDALWESCLGGERLGTEGVVLQDRPRNCGAAALATAAARLGAEVDLRSAERLCRTTASGATMLGLRDGARRLGLRASGVRFPARDAASLVTIRPPAILRTRGPHFIVLERVETGEVAAERAVQLADPAVGRLRTTAAALAARWTGEALLLRRRATNRRGLGW